MSSPQYVGFWLRTLAALVDSVLVLFLIYPLLFFVLKDPLGTSTAGLLVQLILPAVAIMIFWQAKSASPGKMALGAVIVDADTLGKPGNKQWLIRYLGYYVSTIPLMLGLIWVGIDKRKQGWHDKMANTVVVFSNSLENSDKPDKNDD